MNPLRVTGAAFVISTFVGYGLSEWSPSLLWVVAVGLAYLIGATVVVVSPLRRRWIATGRQQDEDRPVPA